MTTRKKALLAACGAISVLLIAASAASAATRYATPNGLTTGNCSDPNPANMTNGPCTLRRAIENAVTPDEVIVGPGDYTESAELSTPFGQSISVHGADGQPMPRIITSANNGLSINDAGTSVRRLRIEHSGAFSAINAFNLLVAEQIIAHSTTATEGTCNVGWDETMRDSVCWNTANGGIALLVEPILGTFTANIRNVTAVATGTGSYGIEVSTNNDSDQTLVAKNVIADGVAADVRAQASSANSNAIVTLSTSNYATELETQNSGIASVTNPGPPNQTAPPLFSDAGLGLFHQAFGSPTINAGETGADLLGSADVDGEPRIQNGAIDIGADEGNPSAPPVTNPPNPPLTPLTPATPAQKKCKKGRKLKKGKCVKKKRKKRK